MKLIILMLVSVGLYGQVVYTPSIPPQTAVAAKVIATAGTGVNSVSCTVVGNTVPATAIIASCVVGTTNIPAYTIPLSIGVAYTFQFNFDVNAVTFIINKPSSGPITARVTANGSPETNATY